MAADNSDNRYNHSYPRGRDGGRRGRRGGRGGSYDSRRNRERYSAESEPISAVQLDTPLCPYCGQAITDLPAALADKETGEPVHFDCVLKVLNERERLKENEKIVYIGQGRFAVASFDNPRDTRHFNIQRIIEWEERDKKYEWRTTIADLYSQIK